VEAWSQKRITSIKDEVGFFFPPHLGKMKSILMHVKAADSLRQARKVPFSAEKEERELPNSAQESKG